MQREKTPVLRLVRPNWSTDDWCDEAPEPAQNPVKQALLRQSLAIIKNQSNNENAVREIFEAAIQQHFYDIAFEALEYFSGDSAFNLCVCIGKALHPRYWKYLPPKVISYCEMRVLQAAESRSSLGFGGHFQEQRSAALGALGRYHFVAGRITHAMELWDSATDAVDVDEVIGEMCESIARLGKDHFAYAVALVSYMATPSQKATTLARLSRLAD